MVEVGHWVIRVACLQIQQWQQDVSTAKLFTVIKISAVQFQNPDFVNTVLKALEDSRADPAQLTIEVTEEVLTHTQTAPSTMRTLGAASVTFSIHDFGTGHISLENLKHLPISFLVIDRSVVQRISTLQMNHTMAQTILAMAQSLGIDVMDDGVETEAQHETLKSLGSMQYRGSFFETAMTAQALMNELKSSWS